MVRYTLKQRIFIVETYLLKRQNYDRFARKFRRRFPGATVSSKPCVIKLFRKWRELGSVQEKKKNGSKTVSTEEKLADIQARMQIRPRKFSRRLAQENHFQHML